MAAGLLAGSILGLGEAAFILHGMSERIEAQALWFGPLLYAFVVALAGGGVGFALGLAGRWRPGAARLSAFLIPVLLFGGGFVFARFRIIRDLLGEHPLSLLQLLALLGILGALFLIVWRVLFGLTRRSSTPPVLRPALHVLLAAAIVLLGFGASHLAAAERPAPHSATGVVPAELAERPNIILIMIDTLRADRLPQYGYDGQSAPAFERLAADGVVFENASAQASWTKPSTATLLSGLYPSTHRAIGKPDRLPRSVTTLAEALADAGWRTGGIVTNVNLSPSYQFDQGFHEYLYLAPDYFFGAEESSSKLAVYNSLRLVRERFISREKKVEHYYQDAATVTEAATAWIDRHSASRFFLFLHYMDPHDPYFRHPYDGTAVARVQTPRPAPERAGELSDLYDGEIAFLDGHLGEFLGHLKRKGLYEDALIILTSDHGEEFHEHGGWWHGTTLYDEQIQIPLILKPGGPGAPPAAFSAGSRFEGMARILDVAPTVLDLAGVKIPEAMQGRSLADGQGVKESFAEEDLEGNRLRSLRTLTWKTTLASAGNPRGLPEVALFDLAADPGEIHNIAEGREGRWKAMRARMDHTLGEALRAAVTGEQVEVDAATRERLRALGYVE